jgi:hypothetical protein
MLCLRASARNTFSSFHYNTSYLLCYLCTCAGPVPCWRIFWSGMEMDTALSLEAIPRRCFKSLTLFPHWKTSFRYYNDWIWASWHCWLLMRRFPLSRNLIQLTRWKTSSLYCLPPAGYVPFVFVSIDNLQHQYRANAIHAIAKLCNLTFFKCK